jgi:hypothetical protein
MRDSLFNALLGDSERAHGMRQKPAVNEIPAPQSGELSLIPVAT